MELKNIFSIIEILISVLLIIFILLQQREGGLGTMFGGSSGGENYRSKQGLEKFLTNGTIVLIILFVINSTLLALAFSA